MAGNFAQFGVRERQLSDVTSVQSPVQDTSSATAMTAISQGISGLGSAALTAFKIDKEQQERELGLQQEQALAEQKQAFEKKLLKAKDIVDQEGSTSIAFRTFLTKSFDESSLDLETKAKMMRDFQSTVLGKSFTELSPEEEVFRQHKKEAGANFYYTEDSSEEEIEQGVMDYITAQRKAEANRAEIENINLQRAKIGLTQDERSELEAQLSSKQFNAVASLVANGRTTQKNKIGTIIRNLQKNQLTASDAQEQLRASKGEIEALVATMSRNVKDRASLDALTKPLLDLYDVAIERSDSANVLKEIEAENKLIEAKARFNLLHNDPELAEMSAFSSLFGHNPALASEATLKYGEIVVKNSKEGERPADVTESTKDNKLYLDTLSSAIDSIGMRGPTGRELVDQESLLTNINNTLLGSNRYIDAEDPPTQNKQLLQWLAQPRVGEYIKDNLGQLTPQARVKLADTLYKNAENYVYPRAQELVGNLFTEVKQAKRAISRSVGVTEEEVEMTAQGLSVVFRGSTPEGQRVADTLNREVAGALTTYFNATANLSEDTFSTVFERERQSVWPSKYAELQEEPTTEE